jgi:hypothetical protein
MATIDEVLGRLAKVRPNGERSWMACCPAHADRNPSLSVSDGEGGRTLFKCFAGCPAESVAAALGYRMADLMGEQEEKGRGRKEKGAAARREPETRNQKPGTKRRDPFSLAGLRPGDVWRMRGRDLAFVCWYDYKDAGGAVIYRKLRFRHADGPGKTFIQVTPAKDGSPRWEFGRASNGVGEALYNLPEVLAAARAGGEVWIVEGEKDADTARALGLAATTNADGAGHWRPELAGALRGCSRVTVIATAIRTRRRPSGATRRRASGSRASGTRPTSATAWRRWASRGARSRSRRPQATPARISRSGPRPRRPGR